MNPDPYRELFARYPSLKVAVVGDFCLDRYLEIDPALSEQSIETGLEVFNITQIRSQPGGAGTILNNLAALGIGQIYPVGFCGLDGEGYELGKALQTRAGVDLAYFCSTTRRRTFTYTKPLMIEPGRPLRELNRLDIKNWEPTPAEVTGLLQESVLKLAGLADAFIVLDQVDAPETGVVTRALLETLGEVARKRPGLLIMADSRRGLKDFPPVTFKMNSAELGRLTGTDRLVKADDIGEQARSLARRNQNPVFVTMAEQGILGVSAAGKVEHLPALLLRGPIDIVGGGDAVAANLTAALAAGSSLRHALEIANLAASIVIHQLGTTGTASPEQIIALAERS